MRNDLLERLASRPGVVSAAEVGIVPVSGSGWNGSLRTDSASAGEAAKESNFNRVGPGYFRTMGTQLVAGRDFDVRDNLSAPKIAIVNESFVKKIFNGENPVGRSIRVEAAAGKPDEVYQVVGVVRNTKYYEPREEFFPICYFPMAQDAEPDAGTTYVPRTAGAVGSIMTEVKRAAAEVSPSIGIEFRPLAGQIQESLPRERLMATLPGAFGILAGLLATLGLYGVISYMVAKRRNEIGLRIALGADRAGRGSRWRDPAGDAGGLSCCWRWDWALA